MRYDMIFKIIIYNLTKIKEKILFGIHGKDLSNYKIYNLTKIGGKLLYGEYRQKFILF